MESRQFLEKYINAYSPVAQEWEGQKVWADYIKPFVTSLHDDNYGTAYGIVGTGEQDRYKVGIEAHCDEIAWMVTYIDGDGLIYVTRHGGSDAVIAPSMTGVVHTRKNGLINGVFGFPAIHIRKGEDKAPKPETLWFDIGVDSKEKVLELGIEPGNIVTFRKELEEMGDYYVGKALDNKIGGYIIAETVKRIKENKVELPYDLYVINSVQEEVGLYGARNIAQKLKLDVCFVHDVCHSTNTPTMSKVVNCDVKAGNGPTLEYTSQNHRGLIDYIREVADSNEIPYQTEVGSYGNDTMGFFLANTVTAIISSPLKYMHTTVEMVHKQDVEKIINLFYLCLVNLTPRSWKYHNFN